MNKKLLILAGVVVVLVVAGIAALTSTGSSQTVTIDMAKPVRVQLYAAIEQDDDLVATGSPLRTIEGNETFSIKKGSYVLVATDNNFDSTPLSLEVADEPVTKIVDIAFNQPYLLQLLAQEKTAILAAINTAYPSVAAGYSIGAGQLFDRGDWYGTTLIDNRTTEYDNSYDKLRVVLHKEDSGWKVVTTPPDINLSAQTYPNVPITVLRVTNRM